MLACASTDPAGAIKPIVVLFILVVEEVEVTSLEDVKVVVVLDDDADVVASLVFCGERLFVDVGKDDGDVDKSVDDCDNVDVEFGMN